jgi:hypothetical protein
MKKLLFFITIFIVSCCNLVTYKTRDPKTKEALSIYSCEIFGLNEGDTVQVDQYWKVETQLKTVVIEKIKK